MPDDEPAAAGNFGSISGTATTRGRGLGRLFSATTSFDLKIPGLESVGKSLASVNAEMRGLKESLRDLSSTQYMLSRGIVEMLGKIEKQAKSTATAIGGVNAQFRAMNAPSGRGGPAMAVPTGGAAAGGGGGNSPWGSTPPPAAPGAGAGGGVGALLGGESGGGMMGFMGIAGDLAMFPLRFIRDRIQTNRQTALFTSQALSGMAFASGRSSAEGLGAMFGNLQNLPTGLLGTPGDITNVMAAARAGGATYGFGGLNAPRAPGFFASVAQMQKVTPGVPAGQLAGALASQVGNVGAQQASAYYTGGAFSLVKMGGGMKTTQEWAEGILRWLENQRPGKDRGKPFNYGEILAQHFPGSNIDAWLNMNGVSPEMKDFFWNYAEGKAKGVGGTQGDFEIAAPAGNLAYERLRATTETTRGEFGLAGRMTGQYANRETVNRWFNSLLASISQRIIPALTESGAFSIIQWLPDMVEDMLFGLLESSGPIGQVLGGGMLSAVGAAGATGDVGDVGDYGPLGGTTTAGLHPDMRRKVNAMQRANPRVRVTSGMRDRSTQMRLHRRGVGRVSGGPSAHTRGMAADLGPQSEYGWITANAGRFGLNSGAGAGEPWHVGMGDIGDNESGWQIGGWTIPGTGAIGGVVDTADSMMKFFGALIEVITTPLKVLGGSITGMFDLAKLMGGGMKPEAFLAENIPSFLETLLGPFGSAGKGGAGVSTRFDPSFSGKLTQNIALGTQLPPGLNPFSGSYIENAVGGMMMQPMSEGGIGFNQAAQLAYNAGFRGAGLSKAIAIAMAESQLNPTARGDVGIQTGTWGPSLGLWQVRSIKSESGTGRSRDATRLFDPGFNAAAAYEISGGGSNFRPWSVYTSGAYQQYMDEASAAVRIMGLGDMEYGGGGSTYRVAPVIFNNSFNISGSGGGNNNIDVRRTVTLLADHLETEMKQRMARSN